MSAQKAAEQCLDQVQNYDVETKSGREQATERTAACAADAVCAYYGVPPGVCGPVGGEIGKQVVKAWNSVFGGNEKEWREYYEGLRQAAVYFGTLTRLGDVTSEMTAALYESAARVTDMYYEVFPEDRAQHKFGGAAPSVERFCNLDFRTHQRSNCRDVRIYLDSDHAKQLLAMEGAQLEPLHGSLEAPNVEAEWYKYKPANVDAAARFAESLIRRKVVPFYASLQQAEARVPARLAVLKASRYDAEQAVQAAASIKRKENLSWIVAGIGVSALAGVTTVWWIRRR